MTDTTEWSKGRGIQVINRGVKMRKQEQEGKITSVNLLKYINGKAREMKGVSEGPNPYDLA